MKEKEEYLESIQSKLRKLLFEEIALEELRTQKQVMSDIARNLFAPIAPAADKGTAIMRAFNTGMAVFDGAMLGIKLMRKIRKIFRH